MFSDRHKFSKKENQNTKQNVPPSESQATLVAQLKTLFAESMDYLLPGMHN